MTTFALNNLWTYLQGLSLKKKDREWLAGKLLEPTYDVAKTTHAHEVVKAETGWADSFAGAWKDSRSTDEILKDIYDSRTSNNMEIVL